VSGVAELVGVLELNLCDGSARKAGFEEKLLVSNAATPICAACMRGLTFAAAVVIAGSDLLLDMTRRASREAADSPT